MARPAALVVLQEPGHEDRLGFADSRLEPSPSVVLVGSSARFQLDRVEVLGDDRVATIDAPWDLTGVGVRWALGLKILFYVADGVPTE
jgi:hypothetical protein